MKGITIKDVVIIAAVLLFGYGLGCSVMYASIDFKVWRTQVDGVEITRPVIKDTVHLIRATTYQPTESQCDSNPFTTADGSKINPSEYQRWVALSRDLLSRWGGQFDYGDTLEIYSMEHENLNGSWVVRDCMAARYKMSIDFLLEPEKNYPKLGVGDDVKIIFCPEL